jgi:hypothetical protein
MAKAVSEQQMTVELLQSFEREAKAMLRLCAVTRRQVSHYSFTRYRGFFEQVKSFLVLAAFTRGKLVNLQMSAIEHGHLVEHIDGLERRVSRAAMEVAQAFYGLMLRRDLVYLGGHERCDEDRQLLGEMLERDAEKSPDKKPDARLERDVKALEAVLEEIVRRTPPMRNFAPLDIAKN